MDNTSYKYTVAIECMTYNHSNYIIDALNGFVMQQTDFPYVAIVVDDASTDNEPEVILSFFEKEFDFTNSTREETDDYIRIVAKHKTNLHCIFVVIFLKYNHYLKKSKSPYFKEWEDNAKYVAFCEGDDYWTDPLKLQKQVEILEANPSLIAVVTNSAIVDKDGIQIQPCFTAVVPGNVEGQYNLRDYVHHHHSYPTASIVFRNIHNKKYDKMIAATSNPYYSDWIQWFILHIFGDFYYLNDVTTAYRINPNSVTHKNTNERRLGVAKANFKINESLKSILPAEYDDLRKERDDDAWIWYNLARAYWHANKYFRSIYSLFIGFIKRPGQLFSELGKILKHLK